MACVPWVGGCYAFLPPCLSVCTNSPYWKLPAASNGATAINSSTSSSVILSCPIVVRIDLSWSSAIVFDPSASKQPKAFPLMCGKEEDRTKWKRVLYPKCVRGTHARKHEHTRTHSKLLTLCWLLHAGICAFNADVLITSSWSTPSILSANIERNIM